MVAPADWKEVKVADVIVDSFSGPSPTCLERNIQGQEWGVFKTTCSTMEQGWDYTKHKVLPRAFWGMTRSLIEVGDTVITKAGPRHRVGVASYVNRTLDRLIVSGKMIGLRPNKTVVCPPFLALSLSSKPTQEFLNQRTTGMAESQVNFENVALLETPLYLPPLKEQEVIAEALSDADAAIESLDALIAKKRDVKQAAMQQLLTGRTRLPGFTADWTEARLGEHASMRSGGTPLTSVASFYGGTIPWASISDMSASGKYLGATDRYITEAGLASSPAVVFPEGVLLYAMYASIGECCISVCPMATSQAILGIKCANDLSLEFLYYTMQSKRAEIARSGQQGTQANLNAQMVRETMFLMPPLKEQVAIAEALSAMDDELEALTEQVSKLRMVKEGMMQDLLTGKVRLV